MRRRNPPLSIAHHALATAAAASQEIVDLSERHVELLLERRILLLELRLATHLVDGGHVLNGLRVHREPQRRVRLRRIVRRRRAGDEQHRLRVPAKRFLQDTRQLRVSVGHVWLALCERGDDEAEGRE